MMSALTIQQVIGLCLFAFMLASGQILFKLSATTSSAFNSFKDIFMLAANLWFWAALVLYGFATILWIYILQNVALNMAYPFAALGFIIVPAASWFIFKEPINLYYLAGVACIMTGIILIGVLGTAKP